MGIHAARVKILEKNPLKPRYEVQDVLLQVEEQLLQVKEHVSVLIQEVSDIK